MNRSPFSRLALACTVLALLSGCQTPYSFPTPDAKWRTLTGQLQYVTPQRSVIGDCVVSILHDDQFQLDFVAGPGFPLMKLRQAGRTARAEGVFARGSWQGDIASAPERLNSWFALRDILVNATRSKGGAAVHLQNPGSWTGEVQVATNGPEDIKIQFMRSDMPRKSAWLERFVFHFNPTR